MKALTTFPIILYILTSLAFSQKIHKVRSGEHLNMIAKKYGTTAKILQKYNGISNANHLKIGQSIKIPQAGSTENNIKSPPKPAFHTVKKGDTFFGIANKYAVNPNDLKKANPKLNTSRINIGQKIAIPGGTTASNAEPAKKTVKQPEAVVNKVQESSPAPAAKTNTPPPSYTKVVITEQVSLADFAKTYNMTINQVNDSNGWNYDAQTIFDVGSEAYVYRR